MDNDRKDKSNKYVSRNNEIANCPFCRGVIFRDLKFNGDLGKASFEMRCPHCQKNILIVVDEGCIIVEKSSHE